MAAVAARRNDKNKITLPPRRGQIKAQIFESMVKTAAAAASKAGALLLIGTNKPSSAGPTPDTSPPPSNYDSEGAASNLP